MTKLVTILAAFVMGLFAADWPQFRGPNASGVAPDMALPEKFGPNENVAWKTPLPPGHSSPAIGGDHVFVTGFEADKLYTICLDRHTGKVMWRREAPRPRKQEHFKPNSPATPTPVTDGRNVYAMFTDFGLLSYGPDGNERWRLPLGPFNTIVGLASSPVIRGNTLLQVCDGESDSFIIAIDKDTGRVKWKTERKEFTRSYPTPIIYQPPEGPAQIIVSGALQLMAYEFDSGKPVWWGRWLTWQAKTTPVLGEGVVYVLSFERPEGGEESLLSWPELLKQLDVDEDGKITKAEVQVRMPKWIPAWQTMDLDDDDMIGPRDLEFMRARKEAPSAFLAIKLGGHGDITNTHRLWQYTKSLPNVPSPLLYKGVLYLVKEGGILTSLDPATGDVLKQGRLTGALDAYYASPVATGGKLYLASMAGNVVVVKAGKEWELLQVNELDDEISATPAIVGGCLYVRTRSALYCFRNPE